MLRLGVLGLTVALCGLGCERSLRLDEATGGGAGSDSVTSSGAGNAGGAGGAVPTSHVIELALAGVDAEAAASVVVAINSRDGALLNSYAGSELPISVEVVDTSLVSFLYRLGPPKSGAQQVMASYRVTPEVTTITERIGSALVVAACEVEPMDLVVDLPDVPGAHDYRIVTDHFGHVTAYAPGTVTLDVKDCDGTVELLAYARNGSSIIGHELTSFPFEPGATLALSLSLSNTSRRSIEVVLDVEERPIDAFLEATWRNPPAMYPHESINRLTVDNPPESLQWTANLIEPAPDYGIAVLTGLAQYPTKDECARQAGFWHLGWTSSVQASLGRLASPTRAGMASWQLAEGEQGDAVWQSWTWPQHSELVWTTLEDPAYGPQELVRPVLPSTLPAGLFEPSADPVLHSVGHSDYAGTAGYAQLLAAGGVGMYEWRVSVYECPWRY